MNINWSIRFKNPLFIAQIVVAAFMPILISLGLTASDLTTWSSVGNLFSTAYSNPFLLGTIVISVFNVIVDPTTSKITDSDLALSYWEPKKNDNHL